MKNIKYIFILILFGSLLFSCTSDDIVEEDLTSTSQDVYGTGEDGTDGTDNDRDGG